MKSSDLEKKKKKMRKDGKGKKGFGIRNKKERNIVEEERDNAERMKRTVKNGNLQWRREWSM